LLLWWAFHCSLHWQTVTVTKATAALATAVITASWYKKILFAIAANSRYLQMTVPGTTAIAVSAG